MLLCVEFAYVEGMCGREISEVGGGKRLIPSSTMDEVAFSVEGCVDVVVRVFPETSTSLRIVSRGLFKFLYGTADPVYALFCVRFTGGFVNNGIEELVSGADVIDFCVETVVTLSWLRLRSSCLCRVYVDYYFCVIGGWLCGC